MTTKTTMSEHSLPFQNAYAHRDCEQLPPLWQSLQHGFVHIEVDVYCLFEQVFVAHDFHKVRPWKTLEKLYLEPLRNSLNKNNNRLSNGATKLHLFVDVKTPARSSYHTLHTLLQRYRDIITQFKLADTNEQPVTVIVSGSRLPYDDMRGQLERYAALDGRLEDLGVHTNPHVMPFISDNWQKHFRWQGEGVMPTPELEKLQGIVQTAHQHNQKVRFWGTPDKPSEARETLWNVLLEQDVDLINTDDVAGLKRFLETYDKEITSFR